MAIYKLSELIERLAEVSSDGNEFIEIEESYDDIENAHSIWFNSVSPNDEIEYDPVDSCVIPDDYDFDCPARDTSPESICPDLMFTYRELDMLSRGIDSLLILLKDYANRPECTKEELSAIKSDSVDYRNLQARFAHFYKSF